jgi:hypothetical protein
MSLDDLVAGLRDDRLTEATARNWLEMQAAGQRSPGRFAVDASGPLWAARYGTVPTDEYDLLFAPPQEAGRNREYEDLFPSPEEAEDRYLAARAQVAARVADLTDDEIFDRLFGSG